MAGFTINGFGASDSYYVLKGLRTAHCSYCGKETQWALMELKMKIRLLYIPTVSVGKKYAVACSKCKNGYYVDERQRDFILNNPADRVSIAKDGVVLHGIHEEAAALDVPAEVVEVPEEPVSQSVSSVSEEELTAIFASEVPKQEQKITPDVPKPEPKITPVSVQSAPISYRPRKICPSCRMMFAPEKEVCTICGTALKEK